MTNIVKEIRKHEKRYTIILVFLFMLFIFGIGYCLLAIDNKNLLDKTDTISNKTLSLTLSTNKIVLTKDNNTKMYPVTIENNDNKDIDYIVTLEKETGNEIIDWSKIKYSINNKEIKNLSDGVIINGTINKKSKKKVLIQLYMDGSLDVFRGVLRIKEK